MDINTSFPLSPGQRALWFVNHISQDQSAYNINLAWRIPSGLDVAFLKTALKALSDKYPSLRTTFSVDAKSELRQEIQPGVPLVFDEADASGWSEKKLKEVLATESHRPHDLENGPLFRWKLFRRDNGKDVLFFSIHHISTDYPGLVIMFTDLSVWLEKGEIQPSEVDDRPGYDAFVEYLESRTKGPRGQKLADYWEKQLKGNITPLNLPLDMSRPTAPNFRGGQFTFPIPTPLFEKISGLTKSAGISRYTFFLSAFSILLHRYSAQQTILVASPVSGRTAKFRHLTSYCANTVVLKADFEDNPTTATFLANMNKRVFSAFYHKDYPFVTLTETLQPIRDPGVPPIAQVIYNHLDLKSFQVGDRPLMEMTDGGQILWRMGAATWEQVDMRGQNDEYDLFFENCLTDDHALIHLMYNEDLFKPETIRHMGGHFLTLLESMAENQETTVGELPMLPQKEIETLLSTWGRSTKKFEKDACFPDWFEDQVHQTPEAPALYFQDEVYTYQDLEIRANKVANYLRGKGTTTESLVGVCMDRTPLTIICLLGILKCGAAYVPLDPQYPRERLAYITEDAGLKVILTKYDNKGRVAEANAQIICMDREEESIDNEPATVPERSITLANVCYVIYTSGSTGNPKGVVIEHRGLSSFINSCGEQFTKEELSGCLASISLSFDFSVQETLVPLALGGAIILVDHPMSVPFTPAKDKIKLILAVPSSVKGLLQVNGIPTSVTTIGMGGDALKKDLVQEVFDLGHVTRVVNMYGPTEETVFAAFAELSPDIDRDPPIGHLLPKSEAYVLDKYLQPVPVGVPGELHLGGVGLAREYLNRPDLTRKTFIPHPFRPEGSGERIYKTGDLAAFMPDGQIRYLGRIDFQVKIRGFRIELEEIETILQEHKNITESVVTMARDRSGDNVLVAHVVPDNMYRLSEKELRAYLKDRLPSYMVPTHIMFLDVLPLNINGKIDRKALPKPKMADKPARPERKPKTDGSTAETIAEIWKEVLGLEQVDINDNFFDIGGHSLMMVSVFSKLKSAFDTTHLTLVDLYKYTTIRALADFLGEGPAEDDTTERPAALSAARARETGAQKIAIIGMACRFPGAADKVEYWHNLKNKVESISTFTENELKENGVPASVRQHRDFIPRGGWIYGLEDFDADFFNISPREAQIIDPQHRIFMELAWIALEDAGIDLDRTDCITGVYAGCGQNAYYTDHLSRDMKLRQQMGDFNLMIGNAIDFLSSRIGYKFNLQGPMPAVQTACSTSMTGIHMACTGLFNHDCDIALAGGVSLGSLKKGYLYQSGMILSANGQCRPFDRDATGTVPSQGAGIVVLKRLDEAIRDRHHIYAVISGTSINNDGIGKAGFTAPSVSGQVNVIKTAQKQANVRPSQISYIEAHGTGTNVGDPIETAALETVFSGFPAEKGACAIGAVKGNLGHTDIASGIAGIIKTALALKYKLLPPTLHYTNPNGHIKFTDPPFYVNTKLRPWATKQLPRRAGVSAFGLGGHNAHSILEEYTPPSLPRETGWQLLPFSARTPEALSEMAENLQNHLTRKPRESIANVAYTLQKGRKKFEYRQFVVADSPTTAIDMLTDLPLPIQADTSADSLEPGVVFMFTGQGSQYPDMGKTLYHREPAFRKEADQCLDMLALIDTPLYKTLKKGKNIWDTDQLYDTHITQPALFIFEYALARLLMHWGVRPDYMIGHSLGEYVAACIGGVFTLKEALTAVVLRGQLIRELPGGDMVSVGIAEEKAKEMMPEGLSLAALNTPKRTVVSGPSGAANEFRKRCRENKIPTIPLKTSHAFHSAMMDPILDKFRAVVEGLEPRPFNIPIISNVTGTWLTAEEAASPQYWVDHMRNAVRFSDGINTLFEEDENMIFLEVGPGRVLSSLALQHPNRQKSHAVIQTVRGPKETAEGKVLLLKALGQLWARDIDIDWEALHTDYAEFIPLPTYPFERKRYWVEAPVNSEEIHPGMDPYGLPGPYNKADAGIEPHKQKKQTSSRPAGSPDEALEKRIIKVWEDYLGLEGVSTGDDFFELGGDSMLAVMMLTHLREEFDLEISPNVLINHSTVTRLAGMIKELMGNETGETFQSGLPRGVVELKSGEDSLPPLFICHPGAGNLYFYMDLAKVLDIPNPVYGIEAKGLHGNSQPLGTVEEVAQYHLEGIRAIQPHGPYYLGGSSFGGMVAYEAAQQLLEKGEEIRLLYMVDTPGPGQMMPPVTSNAQVFSQLFSELFEEDQDLEAKLLEREHDIEAQIEYIVRKAHSKDKAGQIPAGFGAHVIKMVRTHITAMQKYTPRPYPGDLLFFTQRDCLEGYAAFPELAWLPLAQKGVRLFTVPGNHFSMNHSPNVTILAWELRRYFEELKPTT